MSEPTRRTSRHLIAGATLAVIGVAGAGFALGRMTIEPAPVPPAASPAPAASPSPSPATVLPTPQPLLERAGLAAAAASAAAAVAAGQPLPTDLDTLSGRPFELRLPFACPGLPQAEADPLSARYDEAEEALRIRATPVRWDPEQWRTTNPIPPQQASPVEAIEGFWITRPWLNVDSCPAPAAAADAERPEATVPPATEETLGIAIFFKPETSRLARRDGKPYETVARVAPDALDLSQGLRLRLRGRIAARPGPVLCRTAGADARPVCLIAADLDEVAVINPATGVTLATWDVASRAVPGAR